MPVLRWILPLALIASGCSSIDSPYIAPQALNIDPASYDESRLVPYRTLVRTDFRAAKPPRGMEVESVAAVTAALIRTTRVIISTQPYLRGRKTRYLATVYNLRFEARMSQNHSWWNPRHPAADGELLEHEQVHFAFSELAARHANAEIERIRARIQAIAATPDDAIRAATRHLQQEVDRVQKEVHARNAEFDRDTVNGRLAEGNHRWFDRVQAELERSRPESIAISSNTTSHPAH